MAKNSAKKNRIYSELKVKQGHLEKVLVALLRDDTQDVNINDHPDGDNAYILTYRR
jgi:hypothetical protein